MPEDLCFSFPQVQGNRKIYPLVRRFFWSHSFGMIVACEPLALVIEEGDTWFFVSLQEGIDESVLSDLME